MDLSDYPELARAAEFHGHLGPYVALGVKIGEFAMEKLGAPKHFGAKVEVFCTPEPPVSCVVDGLQYSTGCTLGKRNISLQEAPGIRVVVTNTDSGQSLRITVRDDRLTAIRSQHDSEDLEAQAVAIWLASPCELFACET